MANPQPDRYTKVANELMEQVPKFKFNGTQLRIILIIWRFTYGFRRKDHDFSLTFLAKATNIHKNQIAREIKALIDKRVLKVVSEETYTESRTLRFNKDYSSWLIGGESTKKVTVSELGDTQSAKKVTPPVSELGDQERKRSLKKIFKESIGEEMPNIPYKEIIDYLNLRANKRFTIKSKPTISFINGRFAEGRKLEDFFHVIDVKVSHWLNDEKWDSYLRPSTLFNATNFENYLNQKINHNPNAEQSKADLKKQFLRQQMKEALDEQSRGGSTALSDRNGLPERGVD